MLSNIVGFRSHQEKQWLDRQFTISEKETVLTWFDDLRRRIHRGLELQFGAADDGTPWASVTTELAEGDTLVMHLAPAWVDGMAGWWFLGCGVPTVVYRSLEEIAAARNLTPPVNYGVAL